MLRIMFFLCECNTHCWLQEPLALGTSWHQQQELLYSSDHHPQQWPVQQGVDSASGTGEHYLVGS